MELLAQVPKAQVEAVDPSENVVAARDKALKLRVICVHVSKCGCIESPMPDTLFDGIVCGFVSQC